VNPLPARQAALLRALQGIWTPEKFIVIGAAAIACHLDFRWRTTNDLDLSVAATPEDYAKDLERLRWRRERGAPQRWIAPDGSYVDILPAAPSLVREGEFTWPDGSARLNLVGFRLAFADSTPVKLARGTQARVASLPSLAVLKMASYLDRPWERDSDLDDIAHILFEFLSGEDERRWSDVVVDLGLEYDDVSPFMLGKRIGALVDDAERALVERFLAGVDDPNDPLATLGRMTRAAGPTKNDPEGLRLRFNAFRRGLEWPPGGGKRSTAGRGRAGRSPRKMSPRGG
jgi:predicted nucleotidyltransferase